MGWVFRALTAFSFFVGFGWQIASLALDSHAEIKAAMIQFGNHWRNPAAIRKTNDFSLLSGVALEKASRRRLLQEAHRVSGVNKEGIELGHFVVKGPDGDKQFACEFYDRVQLKFAAQNMAVNGEIPELVVEGQCGISADINRMLPIWIPTKKLKEMGARNLRGYFFEEEKVFISVFNIDETWPSEWALRSVRVFNQVKAGREIAVDSSVEKTWQQNPVTLSF